MDDGQLGTFVVFEGGDGSGKSTQLRRLADRLRADGHEVLVTREPGGTPIGEQLRELLLDPANEEMDDRTEALLYAAGRAQHVAQVIGPALAAGKVVLCDRFVDSSVVYQGVARGLGADQVASVSSWATGGLTADLTIIVSVDATVGLGRVGEDRDRLEQAGVEFHTSANEAYLQLAACDPDRYLVVDGTDHPDRIHDVVAARVEAALAVPAAA